jgi:hypothetical protein
MTEALEVFCANPVALTITIAQTLARIGPYRAGRLRRRLTVAGVTCSSSAAGLTVRELVAAGYPSVTSPVASEA